MKEKFAFRKAIKKIAAIGAGVSMVGATLLGAAAQDLSEYPAPFVMDGVANTILVIGAQAKTIDTVGAADVWVSIGQSAVETAAPADTARGGTTLTLSGDTMEIGEPNDLLELGENIGNVRETVTEFELDALKGGVITTDKGSTEYNQYLRFEKSNPAIAAGAVLFTENDERNEKVGDFLKFTEGNQITDAIFEYEIEFEEGLESAIDLFTTSTVRGELSDIEDEVFNLFGIDYTFVDSTIDTSTGIVTLEFLGGDVTDTLEEGEIKTYTIDGVDYEVECLIISDTGGRAGRGAVKFKVNGEVSDELEDGDTDVLSDGLEIGIREILPNEAEEVAGGDIVEFFLGANKIEFTDTFTDDTFNQGVKITEEDIEEGFVQIKGTLLDQNQTFEISSIKYRLLADARSGESDIYVAPGHGIREYLDEPEGMLNPEWDIRYEGLLDTGVSTILIESNGDDEYDLKFTNRQGNRYNIPFVDNNNANDQGGFTFITQDFKLGEDVDTNARNMLIFVEGVFLADNNIHNDIFNVEDDDYFIISDMDNEWDETAYTHVLVYESIDTSNRELTFEDLATGTLEVIYETPAATAGINTSAGGILGTANLVVGGNTYMIYVKNDATGEDAYALAIDLNGDGDVGGGNASSTTSISYNFGVERAKITVDGGGIIDLENLNYSLVLGGSNDSVDQSTLLAAVNTTGFGNFINDTFNITLHTESSEFDENDGAEEIFIEIQNEANNEVGLQVLEQEFRVLNTGAYCYQDSTGAAIGVPNGLGTAVNCTSQGLYLYDFKLEEPDENEDFNLGMSVYGVFFSVFDEDQNDEPEELTIEYPLLQRGAHVFVTAGAVKSARVAAGGAVVIHKIETGKTLLDSEVADVTAQNAIVVGGPCVNTAAADLMGNPEDCAEGFEEGKALIKLFESGGNVALLVAGYSGEDTRQACQVLANYEDYDLSGMEVEVNTQTLQITTVS
ncbi:S-layer protein [Candidatus Woesearchaeota archaeon]|nr:S-layer protein [Candidatus Woesearchaeota archaeon]